MLSSFLFTSILSHESFGEALAFVLSNRIADDTLLPTQLFSLFMTLQRQHPEVLKGSLADLQAVYDRVRFLRFLKAEHCPFSSVFATSGRSKILLAGASTLLALHIILFPITLRTIG